MQQQRRDTSQDLPYNEAPTLQEVASAVGALENYKAAGVCGISPEMIDNGGQDGFRVLHVLIVDAGTKASCHMTGERRSLCLYTRKVS